MIPNFIIIGAMKSGTTSLHNYLNLHPDIEMAQMKEVDFFIDEKNWKLGFDWYQQQFNGLRKSEHQLFGESSPNYSKYTMFPDVPKKIYEHNPDIKLIYVLRHPIERLKSHYMHNYFNGRENLSFDEVIKQPNNIYVKSSEYFDQLSKYLEYFRKDQFMVTTLDDLSARPKETVDKVFEFLHVKPYSIDHKYFVKHHDTNNKPGRCDYAVIRKFSRTHFFSRTPKSFQNSVYHTFFKKMSKHDLKSGHLDVIKNVFRSDMKKLENEFDMELPNWLPQK